MVSARVRRSKGDLALLLREVEALVAEAGLLALGYYVDGPAYGMAATLARRAATA